MPGHDPAARVWSHTSRAVEASKLRWGQTGGSWHHLFLAFFAAGFLVRLVAMIGYRPALWFNDSFEYVAGALRPEPYVVRPAGYSLFLAALRPFHSFELVVGLQHLLGLAIGLAVYVLLLRLQLPAWAAACAAAPQLLDAYQIELEHLVLSETVYTGLLVAAALCLLWNRRVGVVGALGAGLLLGAAATTRSVGLPLALGAALWLAVRWPGWRPVAVFGTSLALPLAAYGLWFHTQHGGFGTSGSTGIFLYSRTATFADCAVIKPPTDLRVLCPDEPASSRQPPSNYIWHGDTPLFRVPGYTFSPEKEKLARRFAVRAIIRQPGDYLRVVSHDMLRTFRSRLEDYPSQAVAERYRFGAPNLPLEGKDRQVADMSAYQGGDFRTTTHAPAARWLVSYQEIVRVPAFALGVLLAVAAVGSLLALCAAAEQRAPLLLLTMLAALSLVLPPATAGFDYRYVPPSLPFLGMAAAVAGVWVARAVRRWRRPGGPQTPAGESVPHPHPESV